MAAVQVTAAFLRPAFAGEHAGEDVRMHGREGGAGFDGHVDAAVFTEFVARVGERFDRILDPRVPDDAIIAVHGPASCMVSSIQIYDLIVE